MNQFESLSSEEKGKVGVRLAKPNLVVENSNELLEVQLNSARTFEELYSILFNASAQVVGKDGHVYPLQELKSTIEGFRTGKTVSSFVTRTLGLRGIAERLKEAESQK
jgi:hypothetical protein